jgi:aspartate/tyrosine/aromatic aminotransferase
MAPPDPILGLTEAFKKDPHPNKINLSVGIYKDENGDTPILACVKEAERRLAATEKSKSYLPIDGPPEYGLLVRQMIFGADHPWATDGRAATLQTPGGTGSLRVAGDFLKQKLVVNRIWLSQPTWENHRGVFSAAGLEVGTYTYFDAARNSLDLDGMLASLRQVPAGEAVCLHACCHNPSGFDPTVDQWREIAGVLAERRLVTLVDFAYQGFGIGLREDAAGVLELCGRLDELLICSSFSKNFGLYNERVGALTLVGPTPQATAAALSHAKMCVRTNYSNPPFHGGAIIRTVLSDPTLRAQWEVELQQMRDRINRMRTLFAETMKAKAAPRDFSFITQQRGMFSFSGLSPQHVQALRDQFGIYIVNSGRINVAGMSVGNMDAICDAIIAVLRA